MSDGPKFFQKDEFKRLNKEWKKRLKKSGFVDIEFTFDNGDTASLTKPAIGVCGEQPSYDRYVAKTEYYSAAGKFLYDFKFEVAIEKTIWELHAGGMSYREIVVAVKGEVTVHDIFLFMHKIRPWFFEYMRLYNEYVE
jgi:hypothetical protein